MATGEGRPRSFALKLVPDVIAQAASESSDRTTPIGTTCGRPSAFKKVTAQRWRSLQKSRTRGSVRDSEWLPMRRPTPGRRWLQREQSRSRERHPAGERAEVDA